ncbi:hypothetical protein LT493_27915 [Streptomyces tricolor]|nr:hypothetical protein [Streptomyces tricolor]
MRLDPGRRHPRRGLPRPALLPLHLGLQGAPRRRPGRPAALGSGRRHPGRRRGRRAQDPPAHRHPAP